LFIFWDRNPAVGNLISDFSDVIFFKQSKFKHEMERSMDTGKTYEVKNLSSASQVIQLPAEIDDEIAALH